MMPHRHPELLAALKALVRDYHLDAPSLSLAHKVEGGYYDFSIDGYSYIFTLNNTYYITIEATHDRRAPRINYKVSLIDMLMNKTLSQTIVFKEDLVVRTIEHKLNIKLFLFG